VIRRIGITLVGAMALLILQAEVQRADDRIEMAEQHRLLEAAK